MSSGMRLGSKPDVFKKQGHEWFCTTGLPSDVAVRVADVVFHLHKFPLLSKSAVLERLIGGGEGTGDVDLSDLPGGAAAFELVARFCYGAKFELTPANVVPLRCAAERLEMTEDIADDNLVAQCELFLNQIVLPNWNHSLVALQSCDAVIDVADELKIVRRCVDALAAKASADSALFGWPLPMQSPGGSMLWNGINTGAARPRQQPSPDWWFDDAATLSFPAFKRLAASLDARSVRPDAVAGALTHYAKKHLPGLNRRHSSGQVVLTAAMSADEQRDLLEEIERLLPRQKGLVPTKVLFGLLRTALILKASLDCVANLERRAGLQLDGASLDDLLLPNFSYSSDVLYDVDCIHRILDHFLTADVEDIDDDTVATVTRLMDAYLAEIASDVNLKTDKFTALAAAVPEYGRALDDGLYRAIDVFLKAHPWLSEADRERLCRVMDCQKLSLEACTHAAQNERLPLRTVVQVLFFEQLQLRTSIAGCLMASDNLDVSRPLQSVGGDAATATAAAVAFRENQALKQGMDSMRTKLAELEKECSSMKQEIEKLGGGSGGIGIVGRWDAVRRKLNIKIKPQLCKGQQAVGTVGDPQSPAATGVAASAGGKVGRVGRHKKQLSV